MTSCCIQAMRQLASLLRQADTIFQELGTEVTSLTERTVRVQGRVASLQLTVESYNPRKQKIRESNPLVMRYPSLILLLLLSY